MIYRTNKKINNYSFINEENPDFSTLNFEENPFILSLSINNEVINVDDFLFINVELLSGTPIQVKKCLELEDYYNSTNNTAFKELKEKVIRKNSETYYNNSFCLKYDKTLLENNIPSGLYIEIFFQDSYKSKSDDCGFMTFHYLDPEIYVNNYFNQYYMKLKHMSFIFENQVKKEDILLHYKSSIIYNKDNYFANGVNSKIKLNNLILDNRSNNKESSRTNYLGGVFITYEKLINVYEIEYINILGILSTVGGLLSTLKFLGNLITSSLREPSLKFEILNDIFQNLNQNENSNKTTSTINIIDTMIINNNESNENEYKTDKTINLLSDNNDKCDDKDNEYHNKDSSLFSINDLSNSVITKKTKIQRRNFICRCCYKKDKDKLIALNSYFDKAIDVRNYFKRLIDIEKIKTILSYKNENDKEFIIKRFNTNELEEVNFNIYERELLLKLYQKMIPQNFEHYNT